MVVPRYTRAESGEKVAERVSDVLGGRCPESGEIVKHSGQSQEKYALMLLHMECVRERKRGEIMLVPFTGKE